MINTDLVRRRYFSDPFYSPLPTTEDLPDLVSLVAAQRQLGSGRKNFPALRMDVSSVESSIVLQHIQNKRSGLWRDVPSTIDDKFAHTNHNGGLSIHIMRRGKLQYFI